MENTFDNILKENIRRIDLDSPSDDFVNSVMNRVYSYETAKAERVLRIKKYSLALLPLILIGIVIFVPGLSGFLLGLLGKITFMGVLKYYTVSSIVILTSMYIILTERIIKYMKKHSPQQVPLRLEH